MLGLCVRIGIEGGRPDAILRGSTADSSMLKSEMAESILTQRPYRAISPRFAMSTEVSGLMVDALEELWRAALAVRNWRER